MVIRKDGNATTLHARGRDLSDIEKAVKFDNDTCMWTVVGDAGTVLQSNQRNTVLEAMAHACTEPVTPNQVAAITGMKSVNVRRLLLRMAVDGLVKKAGYGKYIANTVSTGHTGHTTGHTPSKAF